MLSPPAAVPEPIEFEQLPLLAFATVHESGALPPITILSCGADLDRRRRVSRPPVGE
jgi:hypothetical protein